MDNYKVKLNPGNTSLRICQSCQLLKDVLHTTLPSRDGFAYLLGVFSLCLPAGNIGFLWGIYILKFKGANRDKIIFVNHLINLL